MKPSTLNNPPSTQRPRLTDQQRRALETRDVSIALSAGAGCGKTFVLTRRFLDALDPQGEAARVAGIVAITFTDRAAREMRDRIRAGCAERLLNAPAVHREYWQTIAREIDSARIGTIHAFCAGLLRTYAVEAGLDPDFTVAEADVGRSLLRRAVTDSVHRLLIEHDDDCMQFVLHFGLERAIDLLIALTQGRFHGRLTPPDELDAETRSRDWRTMWNERFVPQMLAELQDSYAVQRVLELLRDEVPQHTEMQRRRDLLLETLPNVGRIAQGPGVRSQESGETTHHSPLTTHHSTTHQLEQCREAARVQGGGGKSAWSDEAVYQQVKTAFEDLRKVLGKTLDDLTIPEDDARTAAEFSVIAERLLHPVMQDFEARKQQAGLVDFDDLLLGARRLLRSSESVRRRVAAGIDLLMVDEFQDTDPVQAEIVRDICGDALLRGKLFLVGDVKQSIYRFRRADPRVFEGLRQEIPETGRLPLSRNFRSQPAILDFVNAVFAKTMGEGYEPLVPHAVQRSPTPAIEFLFARQPAGDDGPADSAERRRRREADWLSRRIAALLRDDTPRIRETDPDCGETRLRRVKPGDVAVLFRTLSSVAIYEDALRRQGIEYYLVGGRAFYAQQEVYDLMNLCSVLDDPDDEVALAGVLRSPMFGLTDESLFAMTAEFETLSKALAAAEKPGFSMDLVPDNDSDSVSPASDSLRSRASDRGQRSRIAFAGRVLSDLRDRKDRLPLAELLESFLDRTGYDAVLLTEFLGRRKLANLRKLVEMAREFDRSGMMTLAEFVQRLRESVLEQTDEELAALHAETGDVVRLMTVHQSKGLEFPVVIVADMDWHLSGGGSSGPHFHPLLGPLFSLPPHRGRRRRNIGQTMHRLEEADEDARENARLLYVATTRAADHLILSAGLPQHGRPASPWLKLLAERFNLQTGLPVVDPYLGTSLGGQGSGVRGQESGVSDHSPLTTPPLTIPEILVHHAPPHVPAKVTTREERLPLSRFRDAVRDAAGEPPPRLTEPIAAGIAGPLTLNVTEIVAADAASRLGRNSTDDPDDVDRKLLGTVIHRVIECLGDAAGVDAVTSAVFEEFDTPEDLRTRVAGRLRVFLDSEECRSLLAAEPCHRELDFVLRAGDWLCAGLPTPHTADRRSPASQADRQSGRPAVRQPGEVGRPAPSDVQITGQIDALYRTADGRWHLVDFKTGRRHAGDPQALLDVYAVQLWLYAHAATALLGGPPDEVALVHVGEDVRRIAMPAETLTGSAMTERVQRAIAEAL